MQLPQSDIEGAWVIDPNDHRGIRQYGDVSLHFHPDGRLTYTVHHHGRDEVILLSYSKEGDTIVTDQPSAPAQEQTQFVLDRDGTLKLTYAGVTTSFIRREDEALPRRT